MAYKINQFHRKFNKYFSLKGKSPAFKRLWNKEKKKHSHFPDWAITMRVQEQIKEEKQTEEENKKYQAKGEGATLTLEGEKGKEKHLYLKIDGYKSRVD
jgi:hypothetical protein